MLDMCISIREFKEYDVPNKVKWINNPDNNRYLHYDLPLEEEKTRQWYYNKGQNRYDAVILYNEIPVGLIGLLCISDGQAEYYVTLGENAFKEKGIAKKATLLLIQYAKETLGLHTIYLYTEVSNISAQKLFERVGFVRKGLEKASAINQGKSVDRFYYTLAL